jgi:uncharacterized membrane protein YdjX (TVP38/TMEM64 family)
MNRRLVLKLSLLLLLVATVVGLYFSPVRSELTIGNVRKYAALLGGLWYGPIIFIAAFALGSTLVIPATVFIVAAGVIWGWKLGFLYSMMGAVSAAFVSFSLGRFLGEGTIEKFGDKAIKLVERLRSAGFKALLIARIFIPFALVNYGAGVARCRMRDFMLSTMVGVAPAMLVFVYSADSLVNGTLTGRDAAFRVLALGLSLAAVVLLPSLFRRRAVRVLEGN